MIRTLAIGILLVLVGVANAQNASIVLNGPPPALAWPASVPQGYGFYYQGLGSYLESRGVYENLHQQAYRQAIDNWTHGVRSEWSLKDDWKMRNRRDFIALENLRLDNYERWAELESRKAALRDRGVLSPRLATKIVINGVAFGSYAEYRASPVYVQMLIAGQNRERLREAELRIQEQRHQDAVRAAVEWDRMSFSEREFRRIKSR